MARSQPKDHHLLLSCPALQAVLLSLHLEATFPCLVNETCIAGLFSPHCMTVADRTAPGGCLSLTVCLRAHRQKCCEMVSTGGSGVLWRSTGAALL